MNMFQRTLQRIYHALYISKQSFSFLLRHKKLMLLPMLSIFLVSILCIAYIALIFALIKTKILAPGNDRWLDAVVSILVLFTFYVVRSFIVTIMQVALTKQVIGFFEQKQVPTGQALSATWSRAGILFSWALIAGLINLITTRRKNGDGIAERFIGGTLQLGWKAVSFFVVPILALNNLSLKQTIKESALLFKNTFGESVVGVVGFSTLRSLGFLLLVLPLSFLPKDNVLVVGALAVFVIMFIGAIFISAAETIFKTALYQYSQGKSVGVFPAQYYTQSFVSTDT